MQFAELTLVEEPITINIDNIRVAKLPNVLLLNMLYIALQECSRRACLWQLYTITEKLQLPPVIEELLSHNSVWLAGGAVIDILMGKKPKDYDMFLIGDILETQIFLSSIRKRYKCIESINSITVMMADIDSEGEEIMLEVQFIKRVYDSPAHIIGGFDIDASRFIYRDGVVTTTLSGYNAWKSKYLYINPYAMSETYFRRLKKYSIKGFYIINMYTNYGIHNAITHKYHNFKYNSDYAVPYIYRYNKITLANGDISDIEINAKFLLQKKYKRLYIRDNEIHSLESMIENMKDKFNKGNWRVMPFFNKYKIIDTNIHSTKYHGDSYESFPYQLQFDGKKYMSRTPWNVMIERILTKRYKYYVDVSKLRISNVTTQFTGSFNPIKIEPSKLFKDYIHRDIGVKIPGLLVILCRKILFPRHIRYLIAAFYIGTLIDCTKPY